jgi:hypothetical protein
MKSKATKKGQARKKIAKCTCREPKTHRDCTYCGVGVALPEGGVCGMCHENDIDGPVIRGTKRVVCKLHKSKPLKAVVEAGKRAAKEMYLPKEFRDDRLTIKEFCAKLMKAVACIDDAVSGRKIPGAISSADKNTLLAISDNLADIADAIELGDR